MMRVLLCAMAYPPDILGGGEISTQLLAEGLSQQGMDVSVLTFSDRDDASDHLNDVHVRRLRCPNLYWSFHSRRQSRVRKAGWHLAQAYRRRIPACIRKAVAEVGPDIIHTSTIEDFGAGFWRWAKRAGHTTVHTLRSNCLLHRSANLYDSKRDQPMTPDFLAPAKRAHSQAVDGVVGISNDILQRHLGYDFFSNAKSAVIGNPFAGAAAAQRQRSEGPVRLGVLGRIEPDKGVAQLIDQLRRCRTALPWQMKIAGDGNPDYVSRLKERSEGLPVEWVGWVESRSFLQQLDLLVIPSRCLEAFGRGVVEAYSVGVPVLCLRRGGLPELIVEGETGWVLDDWSESGLANAVNQCRSLASDRMVEKARGFDVDAIAGKYIAFYESLL